MSIPAICPAPTRAAPCRRGAARWASAVGHRPGPGHRLGLPDVGEESRGASGRAEPGGPNCSRAHYRGPSLSVRTDTVLVRPGQRTVNRPARTAPSSGAATFQAGGDIPPVAWHSRGVAREAAQTSRGQPTRWPPQRFAATVTGEGQAPHQLSSTIRSGWHRQISHGGA